MESGGEREDKSEMKIFCPNIIEKKRKRILEVSSHLHKVKTIFWSWKTNSLEEWRRDNKKKKEKRKEKEK